MGKPNLPSIQFLLQEAPGKNLKFSVIIPIYL